jgi:hypothetical protein
MQISVEKRSNCILSNYPIMNKICISYKIVDQVNTFMCLDCTDSRIQEGCHSDMNFVWVTGPINQVFKLSHVQKQTGFNTLKFFVRLALVYGSKARTNNQKAGDNRLSVSETNLWERLQVNAVRPWKKRRNKIQSVVKFMLQNYKTRPNWKQYVRILGIYTVPKHTNL